jgi:hypothetical protein
MMFIVCIVIYVVIAIFTMKLFKKANQAAWKAWVPYVNTWTFFQLGGFNGALSLLVFVPFLGSLIVLVMGCIAAYRIGLKLGKSGGWVALYIFLSPIWYGIVGLDSSTWDDSRSTPSVELTNVPSSSGYEDAAPQYDTGAPAATAPPFNPAQQPPVQQPIQPQPQYQPQPQPQYQAPTQPPINLNVTVQQPTMPAADEPTPPANDDNQVG